MKNTENSLERYVRVPKSILLNGGRAALSAMARLLYIIYLDRYELSVKNGHSIDGEYYIFFTRGDAMAALGAGYKTMMSAHNELISAGFVYEEKQGRGFPNRIFFSPEGKFKTLRRENSRPSQKQIQDFHGSRPNNTDNSNTENSNTENNNLSVCRSAARVRESELQKIISNCNFDVLAEPIAELFKNVITRMYYCESVKNGRERLPQSAVRRMLSTLTTDHLIEAAERLYQNKEEITNPSAFIMAMLINIMTCDSTSHLILRPPEYLKTSSFFNTPQASSEP